MSKFNKKSASFCLNLASILIQTFPNFSVAIITPYAGQLRLHRSGNDDMILNIPATERLTVETIDTV